MKTQLLKFTFTNNLLVFYAGFMPYLCMLVSEVLVVAWTLTIPFVISLSRPRRMVLILLIFCTFHTVSTWYVRSESVLTLYDVDVFLLKPVEFLVYSIFGVLLYRSGFRLLSDQLVRTVFLFGAACIVLSILVAILLQQTSFKDIFIFSEFRSLLLGLILLLVMPTLFKGIMVKDLIHAFIGLSWLKFIAAFSDYFFNFPILWRTTAREYTSEADGFIGAIDDMLMLVILFTFYMTKILVEGKKSGFEGFKQIFLLLLVSVLVVWSLKRSLVVGIIVALASVVLFSKFRRKIQSAFFVVAFLPTIFMIDSLNLVPVHVKSLYERFTGSEAYVEISNEGRILDLADGLESVYDSPVTGKGVGSRVVLSRGIDWVSRDNNFLAIHQGTLHVWIKFGLFGVLFYYWLFVWTPISMLRDRNLLRTREDQTLLVFLSTSVLAIFVIDQFTFSMLSSFRKFFFCVFLIFLAKQLFAKNKSAGPAVMERSF